MSGVPENLKGKKFNSWLVIEYIGHSTWHCLCDCGNERNVNAYTLKIGTSKSCGICNNYPKNLRNIRFGRLTAIEYVGKYKLNNDDIWKCLCLCGNIINVLRGNLIKNNNTTSCGCLRSENNRCRNPMRRPEIAIKLSGENSPTKRPEVRKKLSDSHMGKLNPNWHGGISFEPYCPKWNYNLRERIRAFFGYKCIVCGKSTKENKQELSCHHVEYNKQACCDGKLVHFAALCASCHGKTGGHDRNRWQYILHYIIDEIYYGRSYYTKDEYLLIKNKQEYKCD
jgi:hypothetical protein